MDGGSLSAYLSGLGVLAPGLPDWATAQSILSGHSDYQEAPTVLPAPEGLLAAERRRASRFIKLALGVAAQAVACAEVDPADLATVFSASGGDGHNCHVLCETLAGADRQISPTRFHNSVHNAAAGYWSIAARARGPCQVLAAHDASFAAGLLEALVQIATGAERVMLVSYDVEYPEPLHAVRPFLDAAGIALVLSARAERRSLVRLDVRLDDGATSEMSDPKLERLRQGNPAMRGLPLLDAVARRQPCAVGIEYLAPSRLMVEVDPC